MDDFEQQGWVKLGVASALMRQYSGDQRQFLNDLAQILTRALPRETQIRRRGGLFAKKTVCGVTLNLGEVRYGLEIAAIGSLSATRVQVVRGIALKTESLEVPDWLEALGTALDERARSDHAAKEALERFVNG